MTFTRELSLQRMLEDILTSTMINHFNNSFGHASGLRLVSVYGNMADRVGATIEMALANVGGGRLFSKKNKYRKTPIVSNLLSYQTNKKILTAVL